MKGYSGIYWVQGCELFIVSKGHDCTTFYYSSIPDDIGHDSSFF